MFMTVYRPGDSWVSGLELTEQADWAENLAYWQRMQREHGMQMVGVSLSKPDHVVVSWPNGSAESIEGLASSAPMVVSGVLSATTGPGGPEECSC